MNKKIISSAIAALMIAGVTSFTAFAAMPRGSLVIGNVAFDLQYANDPVNIEKITSAIMAGGEVYIKGFDGIWVDNNTDKAVEEKVIPAVVYKSDDEDINYGAEDQEKIATPVKSVSLDKTTDSLIVGKTDNLIAIINPTDAANKKVTWASSDNKVVTVDNTGKVIAVGAGTATITVTTVDGSKTSTCTVIVKNPIQTLVIATVQAATIGAKVSVTSTQEGVTQYQIFDGIRVLSNIANLGTDTIIYPGKVVGDTVTIKLLNTAGTVVKIIDVILVAPIVL
ncbi:MAG TPA: Ig-like domain-containing protein [Clostridium sp.]|uniref:Ig-like domain-containing protein n=1 Tax=Clostridium sp. TaxID=1506 RepID=UPI002F93F94B